MNDMWLVTQFPAIAQTSHTWVKIFLRYLVHYPQKKCTKDMPKKKRTISLTDGYVIAWEMDRYQIYCRHPMKTIAVIARTDHKVERPGEQTWLTHLVYIYVGRTVLLDHIEDNDPSWRKENDKLSIWTATAFCVNYGCANYNEVLELDSTCPGR